MAEVVSSSAKSRLGWSQVLRVVVALVGLFLCYRLIAESARAGASGLFTVTAFVQSTVGPADTAVRLAPGDPDAHYTRALELVNAERLDEARDELQQSTRMRPYHYYQWLDLGVTLDRLNDPDGAILALRESVRLAPSFAQPRWQLGNLLYRQGRFDEAFVELRTAVKSDPNLFDTMVGLAWVAAAGQITLVERFVAPENPEQHLALANYLAKQKDGVDASRHALIAGPPTTDLATSLLKETVANLITAGQFADAFTVWASVNREQVGPKNEPRLLNGDFVYTITRNETGFGWQVAPLPSVISVSIDPAGPTPASRSVLLEFNGAYPTGNPLLYQLVMVEPQTSYSLTFTSRSEKVVTGGPPIVSVFSAGAESRRLLAESAPMATGTTEWKAGKVDFKTDNQDRAVIVSIQRRSCTEDPCPVFGKLWLSRFSLSKP